MKGCQIWNSIRTTSSARLALGSLHFFCEGLWIIMWSALIILQMILIMIPLEQPKIKLHSGVKFERFFFLIKFWNQTQNDVSNCATSSSFLCKHLENPLPTHCSKCLSTFESDRSKLVYTYQNVLKTQIVFCRSITAWLVTYFIWWECRLRWWWKCPCCGGVFFFEMASNVHFNTMCYVFGQMVNLFGPFSLVKMLHLWDGMDWLLNYLSCSSR